MTHNIHQLRLMDAARQRGIEVRSLTEEWGCGLDLVEYNLNGIVRRIQEGKVYDFLSVLVQNLCADKVAAKKYMAELGIPVLPDISFSNPKENPWRLKQFLKRCRRVVFKPLVRTGGKVLVLDVKNFNTILQLHAQWGEQYPQFMLERQVYGQNLTVQVIGGRCVAACIRRPCTIIGDGKQTMMDLIEQKDRELRMTDQQNSLSLDQQTFERLAEEQLTLFSVPQKGREIMIKKIANARQGGIAVDCTNDLHRQYAKWSELIAQRLNLPIFSVDFLAMNQQQHPLESGACFLKINTQPDWLHHSFSEQRQHDMPNLILDALFGQQPVGTTARSAALEYRQLNA